LILPYRIGTIYAILFFTVVVLVFQQGAGRPVQKDSAICIRPQINKWPRSNVCRVHVLEQQQPTVRSLIRSRKPCACSRTVDDDYGVQYHPQLPALWGSDTWNKQIETGYDKICARPWPGALAEEMMKNKHNIVLLQEERRCAAESLIIIP
jgi:hypothetical protein